MRIDHRESFEEFGEQFTVDNHYEGYLGSNELLKEIVYPFNLQKIKNKTIMEVGVGSGRISKNLLNYKPKKLYGIEPSKAIEVAKKDIKSSRIEFLNIKGQDINFKNKIDYVFSLGVIHHIPEYKDVLKKIQKSLCKKGKFIIWVYGREGNEVYLFFFNNLRRITILLPDFILRLFSKFLAILTYPYGFACKFIPLPLRGYFVGMFNKLTFKNRCYVIFDQLNPSYSKYFTKMDLERELINAGFKVELLNHRLGYSYTAICSK
ncbi:class I SAM-dependent methyltransferase [Candidatus Pelagibacter sp. HIMB1506]|uniref:class I SAM-dependent methyltransferase n=1 Tax=Candidatus Pelagibacter sp. HIMB1506 TaxID=3413337 RepID=UPI003F82C090